VVLVKFTIYLDESGCIHKNANTRYFAVGGFFSDIKDKNKITSSYKRFNLSVKRKHNFDMDKEIKSYNFLDNEKCEIFKIVQDIDTFCGCAIVFDKQTMHKEIIASNIFFNYAVKLLINDCILPLINYEKNIEFILSIDNRNLKVGDLKNLEEYLKTEFCLYNYTFKVTYYDSKYNYGIQLADLIVNTFYNRFKDIKIVKNVIDVIDYSKFRISQFPKFIITGKI
jgi:hypothetical protein